MLSVTLEGWAFNAAESVKINGGKNNYVPAMLHHQPSTKLVSITNVSDENFLKNFIIFQEKLGMTFHVNCLLGEDSHEISSLKWFLKKSSDKFENVVCFKV